ncbi:hypothetical protein L596_025789 [Steinernema carpocapsae]|uniref:Uncharacterized protein n=1 Tax=Steinernema carpocapsae TaxID=34508 RepID=A0A4U5M8U9_STECR|nr:hypothetical protein L596_025789 [Steinernema carpocapsae]
MVPIVEDSKWVDTHTRILIKSAFTNFGCMRLGFFACHMHAKFKRCSRSVASGRKSWAPWLRCRHGDGQRKETNVGCQKQIDHFRCLENRIYID